MHIVIDDHILSTFAALASIIDPTKCIGHADKHTWVLKRQSLVLNERSSLRTELSNISTNIWELEWVFHLMMVSIIHAQVCRME